ncbi:hypothetical protein GA0070616_4344 [Micromonospora nigra]|uniref:DUF2637 domain-containing protein n=1 Tax=Micromonospora nigra TaxID=145857 RepID=A0A1C6SQI9_9ACTN|nr:hypothetical protein [Micromonospora nigra]SCL31854.1 hypothetical protein GA0070616_4344 [Micromonospora nigra]
MNLLRRRPTAEEITAAARAEDERRRLAVAFARDQAAADQAEQRRAEKRRRKAAAKARARRIARLRRWAEAARTVGPLLLVNTAAVGGQTAYAFTRTPESLPAPIRLTVALIYAATVESISLYVNWHAHDALMNGATGTAAEMRRRSYGIAAIVAAMNYSHFDGENWEPTPFAVGSGMASLLSPWLWGLHTRRQQHVQLLRKDLVDETGAVFDRKRRKAFPIRTWKAARWSIEHNERDPRRAWDGYHAEREARRAGSAPAGRLRAAWAALRGRTAEPAAAEPAPVEPAHREPEPLSLDDPEVLAAAKARLDARAARERITAGAARFRIAHTDPARLVDLEAGGLWDVVDATDEPAHVRRAVAAQQARPVTVTAVVPDPAPDAPAQPPASPEPTTVSRPAPRREPADDARIREAYERLTRDLGREPKGPELGAAAGVSKATANRWKKNRRTATQ